MFPRCRLPPRFLRPPGLFDSGVYRNLFKEFGKSDAEIDAKVNAAFQQLFYGDNDTQRIYYPVGTDMAYILDKASNDVRSEGMSYGMMIAVQLDKKAEFDRLWKWAKTYMQNTSGTQQGYFCLAGRRKWQQNRHKPGFRWRRIFHHGPALRS
ncbi:glycosyl hydrolase family 8 [Paenibacillus rhizoplanae]